MTGYQPQMRHRVFFKTQWQPRLRGSNFSKFINYGIPHAGGQSFEEPLDRKRFGFEINYVKERSTETASRRPSMFVFYKYTTQYQQKVLEKLEQDLNPSRNDAVEFKRTAGKPAQDIWRAI